MDLFQRPYERAAWLEKLYGYFPNAKQFSQSQAIKSEEADHFCYLGNVTTSDDKTLGLYEIGVKENTQLARNRVQLRQMVAKQCEIRSLGGALAVYWDGKGKWRFSFISIEYRFNDNNELLKEETASKRYTYLVGAGTQTRTVQTRFDRLKEPALEDLITAFAVEPLNKEFYDKLYRWYEDAKQQVVFPNDEGIDKDIHKSNSLIRLLTRLLFVWFIKDKGLVNKDLFDPEKLSQLIDWNKSGSYYKAVLQNLFFATLNREINERSFRTDTKGKPNSTNYLVGNVYRYRDHFLNDKKEDIISLFKQTPFLNGGLFECLDREASNEEKQEFDAGAGKSLRKERNAIRIDGFSDRVDNDLCVPNSLFFNEEKQPGLIDLLRQYQFTVEESTPLDVDVALDPELLGKVFENLLADFNPETQASARKASGSYYTPREIVSYMVDESLKTYLTQSLIPTEPLIPSVQGSLLPKVQLELDQQPEVSNKINALFRDTDGATGDLQDNPFDDTQKNDLIAAIHNIKILDPAVGSGAFPMGILQRLVSLLGVLDPGNEQWKNRQLAALPDLTAIEADFKTARQINDKKARQKAEEELNKRKQEIEENFNNCNHDYSRKLYLIENSIFGVDIQPIAIQICKLRFFISLAIEQNSTGDAGDNYGIRALPNLETRFVIADTLLGIQDKRQQGLRDQEIVKKEKELNQIRRRHFNARTLKTKRKCQEQDSRLRQEIAGLLIDYGWNDTDARKIAAWNPYNQSAVAADWFDAEYMFGVNDGFNVVIANPPYINVENLTSKTRANLFANYYTCQGRTDIYIAFLEKSLSLLCRTGLMSFIIPVAFIKQRYATKMRTTLINKHHIRELVDASSYRIFENAVVYNIVLSVSNGKNSAPTRIRHHYSNSDFENRTGAEFSINQNFFATLKDSRFETNRLDTIAIHLKEKAWHKSARFDQICFVAYGARLNHRTKGKEFPKSHYISQTEITGGERFCEGENIERYRFSQGGWLRYTPSEHYNPMFPELFSNEKLILINVVKERLRFAYDDKGFYNSHTVINCLRLDLLKKISHRSVRAALKQADISFAKKFDYKFLLAVLNSQFTNWYFLSFLAEGLHFYPNDAKQLPIPKISSAEQRPFICLVDNILAAKTDNPKADTSADEARIDRLIYKLYGLTDKEIATVERNMVQPSAIKQNS